MILFKYSHHLKSCLDKIRKQSLRIGFVPTMGALHSGHMSLIQKSEDEADITVCSIYVNPVQFNNVEDFKKYPATLEADILLLEESGCDILFHPDDDEVYPGGIPKNLHYDLGNLENVLEGKFRPGHFQGVCLVVERFLNIVEPSHLFLGQKDYQQTLVIEKLVNLLSTDVRIVVCPTLRESNGLAMSSRNQRLSDDEKEAASGLHQSLVYLNKKLFLEDLVSLKRKVTDRLESKGFSVDYLEVARRGNLELVEQPREGQDYIILIAAFLNNVRLIDNMIVKN